MTELAKVPPEYAGCWVGGHWGRFGSVRLATLATAHGWELDAEGEEILDRLFGELSPSNPDARGEDWEALQEQGGIADQAEEWLNGNIAPEGYAFGWHDGEFFLWPHHLWHMEDYGCCDCSVLEIATAARFL